MVTPVEQFIAWRGSIEVELTEARQQLAAAEALAAVANATLTAAIAAREALLAALAPLDAPVIDGRYGTVTRPQVATAIGRRARDNDGTVRAAEAAATRASATVQFARDAVKDLELAIAQLEQLERPADTDAEAEAAE